MLRRNTSKGACARKSKTTYDALVVRCVAPVTPYKYHIEESFSDFKVKQKPLIIWPSTLVDREEHGQGLRPRHNKLSAKRRNDASKQYREHRANRG